MAFFYVSYSEEQLLIDDGNTLVAFLPAFYNSKDLKGEGNGDDV